MMGMRAARDEARGWRSRPGVRHQQPGSSCPPAASQKLSAGPGAPPAAAGAPGRSGGGAARIISFCRIRKHLLKPQALRSNKRELAGSLAPARGREGRANLVPAGALGAAGGHRAVPGLAPRCSALHRGLQIPKIPVLPPLPPPCLAWAAPAPCPQGVAMSPALLSRPISPPPCFPSAPALPQRRLSPRSLPSSLLAFVWN